MDIIQHVTDSSLQSLLTICDFREGGISFQALGQKLWEMLMQLGRDILGAALEDHDQYLKEYPEERQGWNIQRGPDEKARSIFVLDRFHLGKYLTGAISKNDQRSLYNQAWRAIDKGDRQKLNAVLDKAYQVGETDNRKQAVLGCQRYINNNWHGILPYTQYKDKVCPPSAEGHVSHVLSARLSSRPMACCKEGVGYMAKLRVMQVNGIDIQRSHAELFSRWQRGELVASKQTIQSQRTLAARFYERIQVALPALDGSRNSLTTALRSIAYPS